MQVADDFNRADSGDVGTDWTQQIADDPNGCNLGIGTNQAIITVGGKAAAAYYNRTALGNDQWASCTIRGNTFGGGPMVRSTGSLSTAFTNYEVFASSATNVRIAKHVNGTPTTLRNIPRTVVDGDSLLIAAFGTSLLAYHNGTFIGEARDASVASGFAGVILHAGDPVDAFMAGDDRAQPVPFMSRMRSLLRRGK